MRCFTVVCGCVLWFLNVAISLIDKRLATAGIRKQLRQRMYPVHFAVAEKIYLLLAIDRRCFARSRNVTVVKIAFSC